MLVYVGVGQAVGPYLVKLQSFPIPKRRKYLLGMSAIALGAGLLVGGGMFLFGEFLVLLIFGKSFGESVVVFKLLSLTWVTQMPLSLMLNNTVLFLGYDGELTKNRLITFVSCIVLSILFHLPVGHGGNRPGDLGAALDVKPALRPLLLPTVLPKEQASHLVDRPRPTPKKHYRSPHPPPSPASERRSKKEGSVKSSG